MKKVLRKLLSVLFPSCNCILRDLQQGFAIVLQGDQNLKVRPPLEVALNL